MFKSHTEITDTSVAPFECYLYIESDNGHRREAYEIDDDTPLDIAAMLAAVYPDHTVDTARVMCGANYAAIITDNRPPESPVVWTHADFYLEDNHA